MQKQNEDPKITNGNSANHAPRSAILRAQPKVDALLDSLKRQVMAEVMGESRAGDDTMLRELLLLPKDKQEEMRNFLRIKRGEIFARKVKLILIKKSECKYRAEQAIGEFSI
jgi:hypothetical protein